MYATKRQEQDAVIADLKTARTPHESLWQLIDQHIAPGGLRLHLTETGKGTREDGLIINGTADKCFETFQNGMIAYGTNPSEPWIEIAPEDPELAKYGPVANFCEDVAKDQLAIIEDAGAYEDFKGVFANGGKFGNGLMWIEERLDGRVIHTQSMAPGQWWIGKDQYGDPNCFYREIRMTVRQVVEKFGGDPRKPDWEKFSAFVKKEWDGHRYGSAVDVGHLVSPNNDYNPRYVDGKDKRFTSCYFELGKEVGSQDHGRYLRESGYDLFPALFFPWDIFGDDVYGMGSPGMVSLSDVKELQHWSLKTAEAVDKMVNPPLMGPASLRMNKVGFFPGAQNFVGDVDMQRGGWRTLHDMGAMGQVLESDKREERIEMRIKDAWHMKAFRFLDMVEDSKRTATEIAARQQQSMLELVGPMNRVNRGILNPTTERIFKYQLSQGRVGPRGIPIPEELNGQKLKIRYVSRMAQAMRSVNIHGIDRMLETAILISKENPGVWNTINVYEAMYAKARAMDVPSRVMRSAEEVQAIEAAQAKAQAQAAQAEQIQSMTKSVKDLATSPTEGRNALTDVVSALGEAA